MCIKHVRPGCCVS